MSQVEIYYVFNYHLKASKGIALLDKITENLARTSQSWSEKLENFFRNVKSRRKIWLRVPSKKGDFCLVDICCKYSSNTCSSII
jgi:hypothetical protein